MERFKYNRPRPNEDFTPKHSTLVSRIGNWLPVTNKFSCVAVMMERGGYCGGGESPDVFGVDAKGISYLIECKISRSDFLSDQKKPWRLLPESSLGKYRYYAAPAGLLDPDEMPAGWGLLEVTKTQIWTVKDSEVFNQNESALRKEIGFLSRAIRDIRCGVIIVSNTQEDSDA
jgi:hypothetical protein